MAWRNGCEEVTQSKPLFLTIYTVVIIGIVVSSFYVFSAIYSSNTPASQSSAWLSSSISSMSLNFHSVFLLFIILIVVYIV